MMNFFEEIISSTTVKRMKGLTDNFDTFNVGMKQILNFQFLLFECLNDLSTKFYSLKTDFNNMSDQFGNADTFIQNYLSKNKISVTTKDGIPLDDAISLLSEKVTSLYSKIDAFEDKTSKLEYVVDDCVRKADFRELQNNVNYNISLTNETATGVQLMQKQLDNQNSYLDGKWEQVKELFQNKVDDFSDLINSKMSIDQMGAYTKHSDVAELMSFISALPQEKKVRIPKIIPQVFQDSSMTMEEKLKKAYDLLMVERSRIDLEDAQLVREFTQLKNLAKAHFQDPTFEAQYKDVIVYDVATDSGYSERGNERHLVFNRALQHSAIATNFHSPNDCDAERETPFEILIDNLIASRKVGISGDGSDNQIMKDEVILEVEKNVEQKFASVMKQLGMNINQDDIHNLISVLNDVDSFKNEIEGLKVKLQLKVDTSIIFQELEKYLKRDEFFEMLDSAYPSIKPKRPMSALPKVRIKQGNTQPSTSRKQKPELKSPQMLVPSRNSKLLGVNDKFLIGDDGKTYLKETSRVGDKTYKEPPITGAGSGRVSYYDRSKMTMEIDGVDAVIDFQPFVPVDELKQSQTNDENNE